jgi:hypothetical protein
MKILGTIGRNFDRGLVLGFISSLKKKIRSVMERIFLDFRQRLFGIREKVCG